MSSHRLQKTLETIGHPEFFQNFEDEGMDDEAVDICMDDEDSRSDLKPLFNKKSGIFIKFVKAYKELRSRNLDSNGNGASFMTPTLSRPALPPKPSFLTGQPVDDFDPPHPATRHLTGSHHQNIREKEYEKKNTRQEAVNFRGNLHQLEPVQIIDLILKAQSGVDTQLVLKEDHLTRILSNVKNRRVAVLSIAGPSRQGKSFLLGYMIKYLRHLSGGRRSSNWMGESESERKAPLREGFSWRNGVERETTGISMWPEPFTLTSKNGSEFDVLLVDTQGVFDHYTEEKDWSTIVGLSLLTSSALIFNISKHLQEDSLKSLKGFMDFGLMAMDCNDRGEKPFQSLTFLIRDWNNASQYNYGAKGGAEFLKYQLNQKHTDSGGKIREQIKDSFEQLHCFLMPDPGENVKDINYDGSVAGMTPNFASSIKEFIETLFDPNTFPLMTISGNPVTGLDLLTYFKKYVEIFNSDKVPSSEDMNRAMTTICNQTILNKCVAAYETQFEQLRSNMRRSFLLENELQQFHTSGLEEALHIFDKSRKMGSPFEMKQSKRELQEDKLETIFNNFTLENKQQFRIALDAEIEIFKKNFEDSVAIKKSAQFTGVDKFLPGETLETILEDAEQDAIKTLQANLQVSNLDSIKGGDLDSISNAVKTIGGSVRKDNQLLKSEAESALNKFLENLVQSFTVQLTKDTQGKYVKGTEFEEYLKSALDTLKSEFCKHYQTSTFFKCGEVHLQEKTDAVRAEVLKKIESNRELLSMSCKEKMNEFEKKYERDMSTELDCGSLLNLFSKCHEEAKSSSLMSFTSSESAQKLPPDEVGALKSELSSRLDLICANFAHKSIKEKRTRLLTQFKSSLQTYDERFDSDDTLVDDSTLQELYNGEKAKAAQDFEDFVGDIQRTGTSTPGMVDTNLSDMDGEAELHRKKVLSKNEALQLKYEIQLKNFLKDSAEAYAEELKEISKGSETEADFNKKASSAMANFLEEFERKSKSSTTSPSLSDLLLPPLLQELVVELEKKREQELEVVLLKLEQDEAELKYAVPEVKRAYRDEMDKVFDQKRGRVSLKELLHHHRFISQSVLDKYKQTNELQPSLEKEITEELDVLHKGYRERVKRLNTSVTPAIGIDLGTTYSCVAVIRSGNVEVIKNTLGEYITPSYVHFPEGGGRPVVAGAKSEAFKDPENTVFDAKRLIGRKFTDQVVQDDMKLWPFKVVDEGNSPKIQIRGKIIPPEQIASHILSYLKQSAEEHLSLLGKIQNAVITVPAYFSDAQRQATKDAGEIAGLNVLKIINEPTAAAIAYGLDYHDDLHKNVLIFDLGGGTFDVAVLNMKKGDIHVKAVGGDTHLGGEDFDNQLVKYCLEEFRRKTNLDLLSAGHTRNKVLRRLRNECEKMKRQLSEAKTVNIQVEKIKDSHDLDVRMTRDTFEGLCAPMFQKCITEVEKTLKDAKLNKTNIDDIVLVGGSTRIPKIKEMLQKYFNGKTLMQTKSSDEIVAHGAAILACSLNPGQDENDEFSRLNLEDVTPFSLGIETSGDRLSVIIPKNTPTPHSNPQTYCTSADNQTSVSIKIYEGENPTASENRLLGQFLLEGIPPAPARQEKVTVKMELTSENILSVTAVGASRGNEGSIKITSHTGRLNRSEIEKMKSENEKTRSKSSSEKEAKYGEDEEYDYGEGDDSDF